MEISIRKNKDIDIAVIRSQEVLFTDVQSALDLMATVRYETDCDYMIPQSICYL